VKRSRVIKLYVWAKNGNEAMQHVECCATTDRNEAYDVCQARVEGNKLYEMQIAVAFVSVRPV
jgi:hypothetical protein